MVEPPCLDPPVMRDHHIAFATTADGLRNGQKHMFAQQVRAGATKLCKKTRVGTRYMCKDFAKDEPALQKKYSLTFQWHVMHVSLKASLAFSLFIFSVSWKDTFMEAI